MTDQQQLPEPGSVWRKGDEYRIVAWVNTAAPHFGAIIAYYSNVELGGLSLRVQLPTWLTWAADAERIA